jgi:two-component system response regulator HupR/HoxA
LHLPPLRQRPMDIPLIAEGLLTRSMQELGCSVRGFAPETLRCLEAYCWPGNVRELRNEILRMLVLGEDQWLSPELLSPRVRLSLAHAADIETKPTEGMAEGDGGLKDRIERLEARLVGEALNRHRGNKSRAARELGLSRVGLRAKLVRYGLESEE